MPVATVPVPFLDLSRHHAPLAVELRAAFDRVLGASSFILGDEVERFEDEFASYCGVAHCVGVASGTAALILILEAAGIGRGDEVVVPAHTFAATAMAVVHVGATPVCADVEPGTGLIDVEAARAAVGPRTAAILPVHLYGQVCAMDELRDLADRAGLALFEDAAQAHGARHQLGRAGSLGRAGAFSFYPSKNLGALGDGGAICTDDPGLAAAARRLRDLGRHDGSHEVAGYNERLDGLQAAFLAIKLRHLEAWNQARRAAASRYRENLSGVVELLDDRPGGSSIYHLFPVRVPDREELRRALAARGIATGVHYPAALPDQPSLPMLQGTDAPVARDWAARELSLPMFPELSCEEIDAVSAAIVDLCPDP
jgi:dTDP-3-amino-3,4,6-trideoxy-alpha-D-glucose transaminase